jgi:hypothetical protein
MNCHEVNRRYYIHALAETEYLGMVFRGGKSDELGHAFFWLLTDLFMLVEQAAAADERDE